MNRRRSASNKRRGPAQARIALSTSTCPLSSSLNASSPLYTRTSPIHEASYPASLSGPHPPVSPYRKLSAAPQILEVKDRQLAREHSCFSCRSTPWLHNGLKLDVRCEGSVGDDDIDEAVRSFQRCDTFTFTFTFTSVSTFLAFVYACNYCACVLSQ
jgi:hypothetical protein